MGLLSAQDPDVCQSQWIPKMQNDSLYTQSLLFIHHSGSITIYILIVKHIVDK